ncbi:MAG: type VI secretion system tube protein Hcp [Litoreibacter sp.]|nr:type VI secretion system tube protein Hcp [Litoreibacter sp.]
MPFMGFLEIDEIQGESTVAGHSDEIDVFDVMWDIERPSAGARGSGRARGRAIATDFEFRKFTDASSPYLAEVCSTGRSFDEVVFTARNPVGTTPTDFLVVTSSDCFVTGYQMDGIEDETSGTLAETVSIAAQKIKIEYMVRHPDGSSAAEHETECDVAAVASSARPILSPARGFTAGLPPPQCGQR